MNLRMLGVAALLAGLLWMVPSTAPAAGCMDEVDSAQDSLDTVKVQSEQSRPEVRDRVAELLDLAQGRINAARRECKAAKTNMDQAGAMATAVVGQGYIAAARMLVLLN